jgi:hypothetical protein
LRGTVEDVQFDVIELIDLIWLRALSLFEMRASDWLTQSNLVMFTNGNVRFLFLSVEVAFTKWRHFLL